MRIPFIILIILLACGCSDRSKKTATNITPTSVNYERGRVLFNAGIKKDSAFYYFTSVTENPKDSLLAAMAYTYMAMMQEDAGDYFGSEESSLAGLKLLDEKNPKNHYCVSSIYNELGQCSAALKNYDAAIEYYDKAIALQQNENYKDVFRNNKAVAYRENGDYTKAITILDAILKKQQNNTSDYARALTNLVSLKWKANHSFDPVPELRFALNIRIKENDSIGITASYAHLSDYYRNINTDSSLLYAEQMYLVATKTENADDRLDALKKLAPLIPATEAKLRFKEYQYLTDSVTTARNKAKNQFAVIRYQSEKTKSENLMLQKDNSQKQLQLLRQRIWIYGVPFLVIIAIIFLVWQFRKRRQRLELQTQTEIQQYQIKTSQKVHDVVANGLYQIMTELEHTDKIEKESLLDRIETLYERSRDISYDQPSDKESVSAEKISEILYAFVNASRKVSVIGNDKQIWNIISAKAAEQLEHVLQELMINMDKHSGANAVVVRFSLNNEALTVYYRDNGIGVKTGFIFGNGLKSTETRILGIGGKLIFTQESASDRGTSIKIMIPIDKK